MTQREEERPAGVKQPAAELLPALYVELRRLAASLTARLTTGQTLEPTALVHEAYLLLGRPQRPWLGGSAPFLRRGRAGHA